MLDVSFSFYNQGMLDELHQIDFLCNDIPMEPVDLHRQYRELKVCKTPSEIIGFHIVNANADVGRISRFCVKRKYQRQYIGSLMMDELLREHWNLSALTCVVNEYNVPGQLFLRSFGFLMKRTIKGDKMTNYLFVKDFEK